jgi:hypothetical protein
VSIPQIKQQGVVAANDLAAPDPYLPKLIFPQGFMRGVEARKGFPLLSCEFRHGASGCFLEIPKHRAAAAAIEKI